jgi:formate-dependent nitrite reductase membrane component NrfD
MTNQETRLFPVDDFVIGYRAQTGWGFPIVLYLFFSGTGAGIFLLSLFLHSTLGILLDLLFLGIGAIILFFDLGQPWRFWKAFVKPGSSWISRGTFLITILFAFDLIYALAGFPLLPKLVSLILGAVGVLVLLYPGLVISYSPSIPSWNHSLIPILFAVHSLANGISLSLLLANPSGEGQGLYPLLLGSLVFLLISTGIFLHLSFASTSGSRESVRLLVRGRMRGLFLILGVGLGILAPIVLLLVFLSVSGKTGQTVILMLVFLLRLAGDIGFRTAILKTGLYEPFI